MKRREFLQKGTLVAGLAGSQTLIAPLLAGESKTAKPVPTESRAKPAQREVRTAEYLKQAKAQKYPPKSPALMASETAAGIPVYSMPLTERLKRKIVPRTGFCSLEPGKTISDGVTSGNGHMNIEVLCDPYSEQVLFHHESLLMPWKRPLDAPKAAVVFPQVRQMVLDGKYQEAIELAFKEMNKGPIKQNTGPHPTIPAFIMHLDIPKAAAVKDYLRTVDFESSEVKVHWSDERGEWVRRAFTSRPDDVVVQLLTAPKGQQVSARIAVQRYSRGRRNQGGLFGANLGESEVKQDFKEDRLIYKCRLDPTVDNSGYAGVVRVVRNGGSARMDGDTLLIENASSVLLLTRIEWFADYSDDKVEALRQAVEQVSPDYDALLERHRKVQSEALNRVTVNFGGDTQYGMSTEELLADQRSRRDYSPALLEKIFQMGRYWFILASGKYPTMQAETNANINLQIAPGPQGDLREGMDAYFNWMESLAPDFRVNAQNIFGMRGTH